MQPVYFASALLALLGAVPAVSAQTAAAQNPAACPGSQPEPTRSAPWGVAFCNQTRHDLVIQFHENDCPAENWAHRGDIYEKTLRAGEKKTFFLCYANEAQPPAPGIPQLRIPGGKGVVTTWSVVGDCGERSNRSRLDARSFYDRGDYKTGIVLLQQPSGAAHCAGEAPASAQPEGRDEPTVSSSARSEAPREPAAPSGAGAVARAEGAKATAPPAVTSSATAPSFRAAIDATDRLTRTVKVFATTAPDAPAVNCRFVLALSFSDGSTWTDRVQATVHTAAGDAPVATRKYGKSVTKVELSSPHCAAP
jgi:hypothetical protein